MKHRRLYRVRKATVLLLGLVMLAALQGCSSEEDFTSEGSIGIPYDLGDVPTSPYSGQVGPETNSYYSATAGAADTQYSVSLTQLLDDADLAVFEDPGFATTFCASINNGTISESCTAITSSSFAGTFFIQVKPYTTTGTSFVISVQ